MSTHGPSNRLTFSLVAILLSAFVGCASTSTRSTREPARPAPPALAYGGGGHHEHGMHGMHGMGMCPMNVPGTVASVTDVEGGVAISFTTRTGDIAELRRRVRHMGQMHEHRQAMMNVVPSTATVRDIDGGARLVLFPEDPARLAELRQHARDHATRMAGGQCPMMAMGAGPCPMHAR